MTYQECIWSGRITYVVSLVSRRNKVHRYLLPYIGREGHVIKEAKNGMLLVKFTNDELRAIPASCLFDEIMMTNAKKHKC